MARVAWPRASLGEEGWPVHTLDPAGQCDILLVSENFGTGHTRAAEAILRGEAVPKGKKKEQRPQMQGEPDRKRLYGG